MSAKHIYTQGNTQFLRRIHYLHLHPHCSLRELFPCFRLRAADGYPHQSLSRVQFLSTRLQMRVFDEMKPRRLSNAMAVSA
jgi:hypothetical protein